MFHCKISFDQNGMQTEAFHYYHTQNTKYLIEFHIFLKFLFKFKTFFSPLSLFLIIELDVYALFIFIMYDFGFFRPFEQHHLRRMDSLALFFKSLRR